jgi:hypothetical protein
VMRYAIALNGSFFTAQRMLQEYVTKAYDLVPPADESPHSADAQQPSVPAFQPAWRPRDGSAYP